MELDEQFNRLSLQSTVVPFYRKCTGGSVLHLFMTKPDGSFHKTNDITDDFLGSLGIISCSENIVVDNLVLIEIFELEPGRYHWVDALDTLDTWRPGQDIQPFVDTFSWPIYYDRLERGLTFPGLPNDARLNWRAVFQTIAKQNS